MYTVKRIPQYYSVYCIVHSLHCIVYSVYYTKYTVKLIPQYSTQPNVKRLPVQAYGSTGSMYVVSNNPPDPTVKLHTGYHLPPFLLSSLSLSLFLTLSHTLPHFSSFLCIFLFCKFYISSILIKHTI